MAWGDRGRGWTSAVGRAQLDGGFWAEGRRGFGRSGGRFCCFHCSLEVLVKRD